MVRSVEEGSSSDVDIPALLSTDARHQLASQLSLKQPGMYFLV